MKNKLTASDGWYIAEEIREKIDAHDMEGVDFLLGKLAVYVDITQDEPLTEALMILVTRRELEEMSKPTNEVYARYNAKTARRYSLKLNTKTDADIIEKLDTVKSIQGYIKNLIRNDMKKEEDQE